MFLSFIFCSSLAISSELDRKCERYGFDFDRLNADTEAMLVKKASSNPTEKNRCLYHNYIVEVCRKQEFLSKKLEQFSEEGKCSKYEITPSSSTEYRSLLLENALNNPSEKNVCLFHQYRQLDVEKASSFSKMKECW